MISNEHQANKISFLNFTHRRVNLEGLLQGFLPFIHAKRNILFNYANKPFLMNRAKILTRLIRLSPNNMETVIVVNSEGIQTTPPHLLEKKD